VSGPAPASARISGTPSAQLKVKLNAPTANLTALLVDYGEDTRVDYLGRGEGIETLTTESCHGESTAADDACYRQTRTTTVTAPVNVVGRGWLDAQNSSSLSDPTPLTPGEYTSVRWTTLAQEYVLKKGHRLALIIAGTDADYNTETPTGARVTVDLAGSSVTVPVVPTPGEDVSALVAPLDEETWRGPADVFLPRQPRHLY
jgi:X-Pro dipeptidyl-peptidase